MISLPLFATITALLCGPLLYGLAQRRPAVLSYLDGFVLVSIAGLVLLDVLPGAYSEGGIWSLAFLALGAAGPSMVERTLHRARREAHLITLALAVFGLFLHSLADGVALAPEGAGESHHGHGGEALAIAIVVHSVPVGLVIWWIMAPVFGRVWPALTLALMCVATIAGYFLAPDLSHFLGERAFAWFEALVAGSILHVVFGRPHLEEDSMHRTGVPPFEGLGNLSALVGLGLVHQLDEHPGIFSQIVEESLVLLAPGAPGLLLGILALTVLRAGWSRWRLDAYPVGIQSLVLVLAMSVSLLGWELSLIYLVAWTCIYGVSTLLAVSTGASMTASAEHDRKMSLHSSLMSIVDQGAPWLITGCLLGALLASQIQNQTYAFLQGIPFSFLILVAICALKINPLMSLPVAVVLLTSGVSVGTALAMVLVASSRESESWSSRACRLVFAIVAAVLIDQFVASEAAAFMPSQAVVFGCLTVLAVLYSGSLLLSGGRNWMSRVMGDSAAHVHH